MKKILSILFALAFAGSVHAQSPQLGAGQILGNSTAAQRPGRAENVTAILDRALGSTRGSIIERGASGWAIVGPGSTAGLAWVSAGAGADPVYGVVGLAGGGCNAALTASNGGILYSTASACSILAGTATARQMLQSGASTAPAWSTATWPATTTINRILYSSAANVVSEITTAINSVLLTNGSGVPAWASTVICGNLPALTGDVTSLAGNCATVVANISTAATMAGFIAGQNIAAPTTPSAGVVRFWTDSTDLRLHDKNSAGTIGTTVVADTGVANNFVTAISAAGVISKSRPACANLSDSTALCTTVPGTGVATALAAAVNASGGIPSPTPTRAGDVMYWNGTNWATLAGNNSGTQVLQETSSGVPSWATVTGTGTVTSVGFTGGLISVATPTSTPALTVAGTSGGIPYFSSASTWASSAALASNAIVVGGGAGAAPATVTTGSNVLGAIANALSANGGLTTTIASGATAMGTGAIGSAACATVVTATATNTATTDVLLASFNGDPTAVTGYVPLTSGMLTIIGYPTANTANFKVCNNTGASITPGLITLNWRVVR